jgi:hypothetical protein
MKKSPPIGGLLLINLAGVDALLKVHLRLQRC